MEIPFGGGRLTRRNCCVTCTCVECHYVHLYHQAIILGMSHQQRVFHHTQQKGSLGETNRRNKAFFTTYRQKKQVQATKKKTSPCAWCSNASWGFHVESFRLRCPTPPMQKNARKSGSKALYSRMDNDGFAGLPNRLDWDKHFILGGWAPFPIQE